MTRVEDESADKAAADDLGVAPLVRAGRRRLRRGRGGGRSRARARAGGGRVCGGRVCGCGRRRGGRGAYRDQAPPLVGAAVVWPLLYGGAVGGGPAGDIERLPAVPINDLNGAGPCIGDLPLLVGAAVVFPLLYGGAVGGGPAGDFERLPAVDIGNPEVPTAGAGQPPLLVPSVVSGPLLHRGAVAGGEARNVEDLVAVLGHEYISGGGVDRCRLRERRDGQIWQRDADEARHEAEDY